MTAPSAHWTTVRTFGTYRKLDGTPHTGSVRFTVDTRVVAVTDEVIFPAGSALDIALDDTGSISINLPAVDDPDNTPSNWSIRVEEKLTAGGGQTYYIAPTVAMATNGLNLRAVVLPGTPGTPATVEALRGVAGGIAELDADGDVIDAAGNKLGGGTGGGLTQSQVDARVTAKAVPLPPAGTNAGFVPVVQTDGSISYEEQTGTSTGGTGTGGASSADQLSYNNTVSHIDADNVQDAVDSLVAAIAAGDQASITAARSGVMLATDVSVLDRGHGIAGAEETMPRTAISGSYNATAGTVFFSYFTPRANRTLTTLEVWTSATAASPAPSLARLGLYSVAANGDLTLLASTANDATLFTTAQAQWARALTASQAITKGQRYAVGTLQVGSTTAPKIYGCVTTATMMMRAPIIASSLPSQTDLPASVPAASLVSTSGTAYAAVY